MYNVHILGILGKKKKWEKTEKLFVSYCINAYGLLNFFFKDWVEYLILCFILSYVLCIENPPQSQSPLGVYYLSQAYREKGKTRE